MSITGAIFALSAPAANDDDEAIGWTATAEMLGKKIDENGLTVD